MDIKVDSYVESMDGTRRLFNHAFVSVVALIQNDHPIPVPRLDPTTEDEAAERDGVKNNIEIVENYLIDAYTETDCRYTIDVNSAKGPFVHYDVSDIVNDFFTEHK